MQRTWLRGTIIALCLAGTLAALAWISVIASQLNAAQVEAQHQAQIERNIRLALWRLDSALAPLIAQEAARPYFVYRAFTASDCAYTWMFTEIRPGDVLVPSPLFVQKSPGVLLYFQLEPDGRLTSPQVPQDNIRRQVSRQREYFGLDLDIESAAALLEQFGALAPPGMLRDKLPANPLNSPQSGTIPGLSQHANTPIPASRVREGAMRPLWVGQALTLARRVSVGDADYIQGVWLNWPEISASLLDTIQDLLPTAQLVPSESESGDSEPYRLASLPIHLIPGPVPPGPATASSFIRTTLIVAWTCMLSGAAAAGFLLWRAISLSRQQAAVVSAIAHEYRTFLTTVSVHTGMLEAGTIPEPAKPDRHLAALRAESQRLSRVMENALAYLRLERGGHSGRLQTITLAELIDSTIQRLRHQAEQAGMELSVDIPESTLAVPVNADPLAIEQILLNLVDNASRHAATAIDRQIHLQVDRSGNTVLIGVRDHGPGFPRIDSRKLVRPFADSARHATCSALSTGLGLAVSRRLARRMKGDLRADPGGGPGACLVLSLPVARKITPQAGDRPQEQR